MRTNKFIGGLSPTLCVAAIGAAILLWGAYDGRYHQKQHTVLDRETKLLIAQLRRDIDALPFTSTHRLARAALDHANTCFESDHSCGCEDFEIQTALRRIKEWIESEKPPPSAIQPPLQKF